MTDAIKRLRDATFNSVYEGDDVVLRSDAERILTDAVAAERERIRSELIVAVEEIFEEARPDTTLYGDGQRTVARWMKRSITEVCGGSHE